MSRSPAAPARSHRRLTLVASGLASVLAAGALASAPSAQAAWTTGATVHGGKVQVCKVPLAGGDLRIRVRLDNRSAKHTHIGLLFRTRGEQKTEVKVRAAAGKLSDAKALRWKRGDVLGAGIMETTVGGLGDTLLPSRLPRC